MQVELTWAEVLRNVTECICVGTVIVIVGCAVGCSVGFLVRIALGWVKEITKEDSRD